MKLLRYGKKGSEKPAALDKNGKIRDLSSSILELNPEKTEIFCQVMLEEVLEAVSKSEYIQKIIPIFNTNR